MTRMRGVTAGAALTLSLAAACSTGSGTDASRGASRTPAGRPAADLRSASYRFELTSTCGERSFLGRYRVTVRDGVVRAAVPLDGNPEVELRYVPSVTDLVTLARSAEASGADVVRLRVGPDGVPVSLRIDRSLRVIDEEECYAVDDVRVSPR